MGAKKRRAKQATPGAAQSAAAAGHNPHDALFRVVVTNPADVAALLRATLPVALVAELDLGSLQVVDSSFVDEQLRPSQADLLLSVPCRAGALFVYVLYEHKSWVDRFAVAQSVRYQVRAFEQQLAAKPAPRALVPVVPILVYHGLGPWSAPLSHHELFDHELLGLPGVAQTVPSCSVYLDDLTQLDDAALARRALSDFATLALWALRDARNGRRHVLRGLRRWGQALARLYGGPDGERAFLMLMNYLYRVTPELELEELMTTVGENVPEAQPKLTTLAERLEARGEKQGAARLLQLMLQDRFGELGPEVIEHIAAADVPTLERYARRVLSASRLDDVFRSD